MQELGHVGLDHSVLVAPVLVPPVVLKGLEGVQVPGHVVQCCVHDHVGLDQSVKISFIGIDIGFFLSEVLTPAPYKNTYWGSKFLQQVNYLNYFLNTVTTSSNHEYNNSYISPKIIFTTYLEFTFYKIKYLVFNPKTADIHILKRY